MLERIEGILENSSRTFHVSQSEIKLIELNILGH